MAMEREREEEIKRDEEREVIRWEDKREIGGHRDKEMREKNGRET